MMKKLIPILTAILLAFGSNGQAPAPYPILVDSQRDTVAGLQVFQANQISFRASYRSGNATNNLVAVTPFMYWQPYGATNATVVTGRWTIVSAPSGTVDFAFTPADLNFATGTYTYQIGLNVSGGPNVIKQGSFIIKASQASIGASPIAFATTNVNWGAINWSGLPAYEYQTNTIAISNALNGQIVATSNSLNGQIASVSNTLNTDIVSTSNALNTRVTANETGKVSRAGDTMSGNLGFTNAGLTSLDVIDWDLSPTSTVQQGRLQWEAARDTLKLGLDANVNLDMGQQLLMFGKSIETNTINKGEVVFVAGAAGDNPTVKRASNASESLSSRTIGIAAENIASNNNGFIVTRGTVYNVNTTNFIQGAMLYLGANGTVQTNLPEAPLHGVFIGTVERVGQNNGQIYVAVQNYQELEELSDVNITGIANNDLIAWNAASSRWQNTTIEALGISGGLITNEFDPKFVAASNSFYPRSNPSNFITTAALSGYATGTPLYVETDPTAVTNVTASGRITATPSDKQVALTFDASGLATGTPIYSVAGLATGTPLYAFTETDTIATNRLTNYYTITSADAKFATGTPLYVEAAFNANSNRITALEGYTNRAASALSSSVWASADSTTNYASRVTFNSFTSNYASADSTTNYSSRITFNSTSNEFNTRITAVDGYTNRAASALASSVWQSADSTTNYANRVTFNTTSNGFNSRIAAVEGYTNRAASALASSVWASADSTTNYASRVTFNSFTSSYSSADATTNYQSRVQFVSTSNSFNSRISNVATGSVYVTNLSAIAGSGLGVTSNRLVVTGNTATVWSQTAANTNVDLNGYYIYSASEIRSVATPFAIPAVPSNLVLRTVSAGGGQGRVLLGAGTEFSGENNVVITAPSSSNIVEIKGFTPSGGGFAGGNVQIKGGIGTGGGDGTVTISNGVYYGNAANLTNFPSSLLTVSQGNTNYWRITTAPTNATESGQRGQIAVSSSNVFIYNPDALGTGTGRWIRISGSISWP